MKTTSKKKRLIDIGDALPLGDGTRCCPAHHLPHAMPFLQKPVTDEQCHTHSARHHRLHHNFFCKALRCPNYKFMREEAKLILSK